MQSYAPAFFRNNILQNHYMSVFLLVGELLFVRFWRERRCLSMALQPQEWSAKAAK
jgi:hypothetical protein